MNEIHLQRIFANYIDKFEFINDTEHQEYYKWQIAKQFRDQMNHALAAPIEEFRDRLYEIKKLTENMIDSYTQPFYGLVQFAGKEPETVRTMFADLYRDDNGDLEIRQKKISEFLKMSHELRDKYFEDSYLYKDDMHSVTGYLFLYDPDHNYIFKATHALAFADCIEFYDDWGYGDTVNLKVYYRMCNQLVSAIKESKELLGTDASRFDNGWGVDPETLHPDPEKHILAFDLIYCCSTYGLFDGISFTRPKSKERQLIQERKEKAKLLSDKLDQARKDIQLLDEAKILVNSVCTAGKGVKHSKYGEGVITENTGKNIKVDFEGVGEKELGTFISIAKGIIKLVQESDAERIEEYKDCLKREDSIKVALSVAEKEFAPYAEYLG